EEEARINAKIDAQFADFRDHTIDVARAAGGVAAALAGGNVDAGADAAGNAAANNYLSSAQQAQMNKELKECPDLLCEAEVSAKWSAISTGQDISFAAGMVAGVPAEIYDTLDGFFQIAKHPEETLKALKDFFSSGEILATIGRTLGQSYVDRINKMEEEYERAGAGGSFKAGLEFGKLLTETASLMTGVAGAAKGGIKLVGKLTEKALAKLVAKAEVTAAKAGKDIAQSTEKISDKAVAVHEQTGNKASQTIEEVRNKIKDIYPEKDIAQSTEKIRDEIAKTQYFTQGEHLWSDRKSTVFELEIPHKGEIITQKYEVYESEKLFNPYRIVTWIEKGKEVEGTNIEKMTAGRAPIGFDDKSIEFHHILQTHDGPLAMVTNEFHKKYHRILHNRPKEMGSDIDRDLFKKLREELWMLCAECYKPKDTKIKK
ncbi:MULTISPECIES: HNH/ENDO VII family nuclease, partial [unclassified Bartonella]|uniref:HNH/ENDO VII family nuclease n=1 Tax=unclassified Bartonella TaxID=2645622 RepID=UPI0035CF75C2